MDKRSEFIAIADEQDKNGSGYLLGAQGQLASSATEPWVNTREHGKAAEIARVWAYIHKMLPIHPDMRLFDCSGYVLWCLEQIGIILSDMTANGIYFNLCVPIDKYDLCPGDLVFRKYATKNEMFHVGIYCGDGTVLHCKGRDDGVVRESIGKTAWSRYGRLKCLPTATVTCFLRTLSKNCKGGDVYALELQLEALGYDCGITKHEKTTGIGNWGPKCDAAFRAWQANHPECGTRGKPDGKCGPLSAKTLGFLRC